MPDVHEPPSETRKDHVYRVLAVGNAEHVDQVERATKMAGHEVVPVTTTDEALRFLHTEDKVDVIVCQTHLEWDSVFSFLRKVKAEPLHRDLSFMMLCVNPSDLARSVNAAVNDAADILGASKYLVLEGTDIHRLSKEIDALLPTVPPRKEIVAHSLDEMAKEPHDRHRN
jgi:CheY-like chemotaxis protein